MKLDKDLFPTNMNMVELERKKVMVRPSQAELTKGMYVIIGEERNSRMVKPKTLEASHILISRPPSTSSWINTERAEPALASVKTGQSSLKNQNIQFV
jgi:hypothetical protein